MGRSGSVGGRHTRPTHLVVPGTSSGPVVDTSRNSGDVVGDYNFCNDSTSVPRTTLGRLGVCSYRSDRSRTRDPPNRFVSGRVFTRVYGSQDRTIYPHRPIE